MSLTLKEALSKAQEGDVIECILSGVDLTAGNKYMVYRHFHGHLYIEDDIGDQRHGGVGSFIVHPQGVSPAKVQPQPAPTPTGETLGDVLSIAKAGDSVKCVDDNRTTAWTTGRCYVVQTDGAQTYVYDDRGSERLGSGSGVRFIVNLQAANSHQRAGDGPTNLTADDAPDKWDELATGGRVKAESKEWQPDTLDVDMSKKISDW